MHTSCGQACSLWHSLLEARSLDKARAAQVQLPLHLPTVGVDESSSNLGEGPGERACGVRGATGALVLPGAGLPRGETSRTNVLVWLAARLGGWELFAMNRAESPCSCWVGPDMPALRAPSDALCSACNACASTGQLSGAFCLKFIAHSLKFLISDWMRPNMRTTLAISMHSSRR